MAIAKGYAIVTASEYKYTKTGTKHSAKVALCTPSSRRKMQFITKLFGVVLVIVGIFFLGQNIIFTTQTSAYWWRDIPATGSVIALLAGILMLFFGGSGTRQTGWVLVGIGIVLVFLSGGVVLRPTSLWTFFLAFVSMIGGYKLMTGGRFNF